MLNDIETWLLGVVPPERCRVFIEALTTLEANQGSDADDNLINFMATIDNSDTYQALDRLNTMVSNNLRGLIYEYGVFFDEDDTVELPLVTLTKIVNGLNKLDSYENPDEIIAVLDNNTSEVEQFASLIRVTEGLPEEDTLTVVHTVSTRLLRHIRDIAVATRETQQGRVVEESPAVRKEVVARAKAYMIQQHYDGAVLEYLKSGGSVLLDMEDYIAELGGTIEQHDPKTIAVELTLLAILSGWPVERLGEAVSNWVSNVTTTVEDMMRVGRLARTVAYVEV